MMWPTVHNTHQFRVTQFTQHVALNVETNNGWRQYKRERRRSRGGKWGRWGRAGVYSVVNADSALGFPFSLGDVCVWCGETPPAGPTWTHDAEAESVSLSLTVILQFELFWLYFTVTCSSLRVFTVTFLAVVVEPLYFYSMQVVNTVYRHLQ